MLWKVVISVLVVAVLTCSVISLIVTVRANYDLSLMKAAYSAELGNRAMPKCATAAAAKGIEINSFSALTPDSVTFSLEKGVGEQRSHLQRVYDFNKAPEKFVGWIRVMIDLSDLVKPAYCVFNPWSGDVEVIGIRH